MAERYRDAVALRAFTLAKKRDIFGLVLSWSMDKAPSKALAEVKLLGPDEAGRFSASSRSRSRVSPDLR